MDTTTSPVSGTVAVENAALKYAKHLGLLILWSGLSIVVATVLASLSHLDVSKIPVQYQAIAPIIVSILVSALSNTKQQIDSELQVEQAQKAMVSAQNDALQAKLMMQQEKNM